MSRAWIAFYMGDYQKDTNSLTTLEHGAYFLLLNECWQHGQIPLEAHRRAAVCKMTLKDWKKVAPSVEPFFNDDGTNKRASKEIAKAEVIRQRRAIAGARGGTQSGISKAITKGMASKYEANANQSRRQTILQNESPAKPNLNSKLESSSVAERDGNFPETNRLLEGLERLRQSKQAPMAVSTPEELSGEGRVWVDEGTIEWSAHAHLAASRKVRMRLPITIMVEGAERRGAYFDCKVPDGYDEATGERISPTKEEDAA